MYESQKQSKQSPVTTAEACETSFEVWMKSMETNMNVVTNEIKQLKVRESTCTRKMTTENQVTDKCFAMDATRKVTLSETVPT